MGLRMSSGLSFEVFYFSFFTSVPVYLQLVKLTEFPKQERCSVKQH